MRTELLDFLNNDVLLSPFPEADEHALAADLGEACALTIYPRSLTATRRSLFFLGRSGDVKVLGLLTANASLLDRFTCDASTITLNGGDLNLALSPLTRENAAALRTLLPFLNPSLLGLCTSAGCGDRLGLATPGHIRAIRASTMAAILAQQSIRENARTGRTPQEVVDDAMWGVLQEGWRGGFGADADHLKTAADIDSCVAAGYTFYTIDPGEHVDNRADTDGPDVLRRKVSDLPWEQLDSSWEDLKGRLATKPVDLGEFAVTIGEGELLKAAAKYGRVVAHTLEMYRHLEKRMDNRPFELEMSVDETETVTTIAEHIYIAHELRRLGVRWVSLAPRYVGDFEKGVDYVGDLEDFRESFARHVAVARAYGPYKLSLHSGSDKFSIYPVASRLSGGLVHLKTAGTSYLEALRAVAESDPSLFREIVLFAAERYPTDRATYHVSADVAKMPDWRGWEDARLATLLDDFNAREVLHVTFGSVLNNPGLRDRFFETLRADEEVYYRMLETHFKKHLAPFAVSISAGS